MSTHPWRLFAFTVGAALSTLVLVTGERLAAAIPVGDIAPKCPERVVETWGELIDSVVITGCHGKLADKALITRLLGDAVTWTTSSVTSEKGDLLVTDDANSTTEFNAVNGHTLTYALFLKRPSGGLLYTDNRAVFGVNFSENDKCLPYSEIAATLSNVFPRNNDRLDPWERTFLMHRSGQVKTIVAVRHIPYTPDCLDSVAVVEYDGDAP